LTPGRSLGSIDAERRQRVEYLRAKVAVLEADARNAIGGEALPRRSSRDMYYRIAKDLEATRAALRRAEAALDRR